MTIVCVPAGRGRWAEMRITYEGPQLSPVVVVGQRFEMAGITWRVREVLP